MPNIITTQALAKINLTLDVLGRRPNGYHEIRTIMQTIALCDRLTITHTPETPGIRLEVTGDEAAGAPADGSNLVHKAAIELQKLAAAQNILSERDSGLYIHLEKFIPSQAGLGGGSSDAAATLLAVNRLLETGLSHQQLTEIGVELGADIPFFLTGGTALVEGLGERVTPLPPLAPAWQIVIVKPPVAVSTAWAYHALDENADRIPGNATSAWGSDMIPSLSNDFEQVILPALPEIALAYGAMMRAREMLSSSPLLCGSGSALFCRADDENTARRMADYLRNARVGKVWVTGTVNAGAEK